MDHCSVAGCEKSNYCGSLCSAHYNRKRTTGTTDDGPRARASLEKRFWKYVDKRGPDECWLWIGKNRVNGYGSIGLGGRHATQEGSHRVAWRLTNGPIPKGEGHHGTVVRHICDERLCCNPAHLLLGTQADNVRDMDERGRRASGDAWASGKQDHRRRGTCSIEGCEKPHSGKGLCQMHRTRVARTGTTDEPKPVVYPERFCSVEGCGRKHLANGLCSMHEQRQRLHGTTDHPKPREKPTCSEVGCGKEAWAKGLCGTHYRRASRARSK